MSQSHFYTTRREVLTGGLRLLSAAATLPLFLQHTARALAEPTRGSRRKDDAGRVLIVLQLAGGNDGLNTVIPVENDLYYKARPRIGIPRAQALTLTDGLALHPAATGLKTLYDAGRLAIVQGVGYPNPNRSHFVATDIWESADPRQRLHNGWLGRYFDACCGGADPQPLDGVALVQEAPLAMQGDQFAPLTFSSPRELAWNAGERDAKAAAAFDALNRRGAAPPTSQPASANPAADYLQRSALEALVGADEIRAATGNESLRGRGGGLGQQLAMVSRMIRAGLPTRVYYVSLGGFDTHSGQLGRQQQLLRQLGDALEDFVAALARDKLLDRVLVMTFSEFGRRVQENASGGTDHGEAAPVFLIGGRVVPGLHEQHPNLAQLHRGDLAFGCDFRRIYAAILRNWLDVRPDAVGRILPEGAAPLRVLQ